MTDAEIAAEPTSPPEPEPTIEELKFWIDSSFVSMPMLDDPVKRAAIHAILEKHRARGLDLFPRAEPDDDTRDS